MRVLGLFVRQPAPGVKSRLAATIGADRAAELYTAFLTDLLAATADIAEVRWLAFTPNTPDAADAIRRLGGPRDVLWPQPDGDLGERMEAFFAAALADSHPRRPTKAVLIGSDSPTLPPSFIELAFGWLALRDLVLGPALDGGYYLIGARARVPGWLQGVRWSSRQTLADTVAAAQQQQWRLGILQPWYDVDTRDDLEGLRGHLAALRAEYPSRPLTATEEWLQRHPPAALGE